MKSITEGTVPDVYRYVAPEVVVSRSTEELNVDRIGYKIIEKRLFDFLIACAEFPNLHMVDTEADVIWHNYILSTTSYRDFCFKYFGKIIEHEPFLVKPKYKKNDLENIAESIVRAVSSYRKLHHLDKMEEGHYLVENEFFGLVRKKIKEVAE